jgi:hypothetical protein
MLSLCLINEELCYEDSPPTGAKDKKTWVYTSTPPYVFKV